MNKIFRIIWNQALQTWVVVSELASCRGKPTTTVGAIPKTSKPLKSFFLNAFSVSMLLALPTMANAYVAISGTDANDVSKNETKAKAADDPKIKPLNYKTPENLSYADPNSLDRVVGGVYGTPNGNLLYTESNDMTQSGIAIGKMANTVQSTNYSSGIAIGNYANGTGGMSIALGSFTHATDIGAIAIGTAARAAGFNSLAIMRQASASGETAMAIGTAAYAKGKGGIALGQSATATGSRSVAIGSANAEKTLVDDGSGSQVGMTTYTEESSTKASGDSSVAIGSAARASGIESIAIGSNSKVVSQNGGNGADAKDSIAIGTNAAVEGAKYAVVIGSEAKTNSITLNTYSGTLPGTEYKANNAIAIGYQANSSVDAIAIGKGAHSERSSDNSTIAIGEGAQSYGGVAIGEKAKVLKDDAKGVASASVAIGRYSTVGEYGVAVGTGAIAGAEYTNDTDITQGATNIAGSVFGTAVGIGTRALSMSSTALGHNARVEKGANKATAVGHKAQAFSSDAVAVGSSSIAKGNSSVAIGKGAQANGVNAISIGTGNVVTGNNSGAIGDPTTITGAGTYSIGNNNGTIAANNSGVFGNNNTLADGVNDGIRVVGNDNTVTTSNVQVLGNNVSADVANSAYIGSNSRAAAGSAVGTKNKNTTGADGSTTTAGDNGTVTNATVGTITYGGFAGATAHGVVTVGAAGNERRIQNVAAGEISATSTDAINGSQLYATNSVVSNVANSVKNILGGDAAVDPNTGNITYGNTAQNGSGDTDGVGGTGKTTIDEAIKHVNQGWKATVSQSDGEQSGKMEDAIQPGETLTFDAGKNIKLTQSQGKISIATKDDVNLNSVTANTVTTGNTSMNNDGMTVNNNGKTTKVEGGKVTGLEERDTNSVNYGTGENAGRAATESAVKSVDDKLTASTFGLKAQDKQEVKKNLNNTVEVVGADSNISTKVADGKLQIELAKQLNLTDSGSVTTGASTLNNSGLTVGGTTVTNGKVAGLDARNPTANKADYGIGDNANRAATEAAVKSVDDKANTNTNDITQLKKGWKLTTAADGGSVTGSVETAVQTDDVVTVKAGKNIAVTQDGRNITIATSMTPDFDKGTVTNSDSTAKGGDVEYVTKGGTQIVNGGDVYNAIHTTNNQYQGDNSDVTVLRNPDQILSVKGGADASKLSDNNIGTVGAADGSITVKLAKELADLTNATFGASDADKTVINKDGVTINKDNGSGVNDPAKTVSLTDNGLNNGGNQITNVASGLGDTALEDATGDTLTNAANIADVKKARTTVTSSDDSILVGETTEKDGHTNYDLTVDKQKIVEGAQLPVVYTDAEGNKLYKQADGSFNTQADGQGKRVEAADVIASMNSGDGSTSTPTKLANVGSSIADQKGDTYLDKLDAANTANANNAVNVSDLKNTADALTNKGFGLTAQDGNAVTKKLGETVEVVGGAEDAVTTTAKNVRTVVNNGKIEVQVAEAPEFKEVTVTNGKDGADGKSVVVKPDAIVFNGVDGVDGKDGTDGQNGQVSVKVEKGEPGLAGNDGKDGESKTRIVYEKPNGDKETVATLNDGLKFKGNGDKVVEKKLNETLTVKGGLAEDKDVTDANTRVDVDDEGNLVVKMAKELTDLTSAVFGNNPVDNKGVENKPGVNVDGSTGAITTQNAAGNQIVINNPAGQITGVESGLGDTKLEEAKGDTLKNVANIGDLQNVSKNLTDTGWKLQTNDGTESTVKLGETVQVVDGANTKVSTITSKDGVHSYHIDVTGLPVVYTDEQGNPLVKVGDTFYKASDLENGLPKEGAQPATPAGTSLVAQDGSATPQTLDNVKSVIAPQNGEDFTKALEKAAESKPNSAVNVSDLHNTANALTENLTQKGFGLTDDNGKKVTQELGEQIQIKGKDGVTVTADANDKSLTVALEGDVRVSGKDGKDGTIGVKGADGRDGTTITKDAIVFNGVDGVNGKDGADGKDGQASIKVEKGAKGLDGNDGNDGKDGESKTRIVYEKPNGEKEEVATLNDGLIFQGNGTDTVAKKLNETLQIKGGLDNNAKATDANTRVDVEDGALVVKMAKDLTDLDSAKFGKDGDNTVINKDGITITNSDLTKPNVSLTETGLNNGGNKITNVEAGEADTDAVNVKQLKEAAAAATTTVESSDGTIDVSRPDPQPEDGHIHYDLKVNSQKVVENAQLPVVYTNKDGDKVYKQADGSFNTQADGKGTKVEAGDVIASMNSADGSTTSPTKLANVGTSIGDISPTVDGKPVPADKANFLDQLAEAGKDGSKVANNAVNVSDLHNTADALVNKGFNIAADNGGDDNVKLGETVKFTDPNGNIITTVKDNEIQFALNSEVSIGGKDGKPGSLGVKGADGKDAVAINGTDGGSIVVGGKDGVPGKDGTPGIAINGKDGSIGIAGKDGSNAGVTVAQGEKGLAGNDGKDGESKTRIVYTKPDGNTEQVATLNDGIKYQGDVGNAQMTLNNTTQIVGGVTNADDLTDNNIGVVAKQDGKNAKLTVKLAKDLKGLNSVTTTDAAGNSTTVQGNGVTISGPNAAGNNSTVSLTTNGLNNGGNRITNVADGKDDTDAVNVRQLKGAVGNINNNINKLNKDLRAGIAGATATAGLPQVYMPGKSMVAAAAGTYKGQGAIAVGYSRASDNGKVILKLTGNANTRGDFGGSVGVGYQW